MKSIARFLLFLFFVLVVVSGFLFTINNTEPVALWLGTSLQSRPLGVWVLLAFGSGALLGLALGVGLWRHVLYRAKVKRLQQRLAAAERELAALKETKPVASPVSGPQ